MTAGNLLERGVDVLELLADHPEGLALSDIARSLGLAKSATHRILSLLAGRSYVERPDGVERYRLSLKLAVLGFRFVSRTKALDLCQPVLDTLARQTGEFVRMALWDGSALNWVAKAQGAQWGLRYDPDMGAPVVLHATASGRAWLQHLTQADALALVRLAGFQAPAHFGKQRVTDEISLVAELQVTRNRGYGLAIEEGEPGMTAIALAIPCEETRRSPGTVSVAGPILRMTPERLTETIPLLTAAVRDLGDLWPLIRMRQDRLD